MKTRHRRVLAREHWVWGVPELTVPASVVVDSHTADCRAPTCPAGQC